VGQSAPQTGAKRATLIGSRQRRCVALDEKSKAFWIQGSMAKAAILCEARARFTADKEFGDWLDAHEVDLKKNDRAALLSLGRLGQQRLEEILINTDSRSYQLISQHNRMTLKEVS
jgi:hypothetical protein